jgi:hypothetical protein
MKVLANLLEEQGLFKEAYIEEIKDSVSRLLKSYLEIQQQYYNKPQRNYDI